MYTVYKFGIKLNPVTRQEIVRQVQDYINQGEERHSDNRCKLGGNKPFA